MAPDTEIEALKTQILKKRKEYFHCLRSKSERTGQETEQKTNDDPAMQEIKMNKKQDREALELLERSRKVLEASIQRDREAQIEEASHLEQLETKRRQEEELRDSNRDKLKRLEEIKRLREVAASVVLKVNEKPNKVEHALESSHNNRPSALKIVSPTKNVVKIQETGSDADEESHDMNMVRRRKARRCPAKAAKRAQLKAELESLRAQVAQQKELLETAAASKAADSNSKPPQTSETNAATTPVPSPTAAKGRPPGRPSCGAVPPPPPKAKGKGPPPPPPSKAKAGRASLSIPVGKAGKARRHTESSVTAARLVNFHFRPSIAPNLEQISATADPYLTGVVDFLPKWGQSRVDRCKAHLASYEHAVGVLDEMKMQSDASQSTTASSTNVPDPKAPPGKRQRRRTIFSVQNVTVGELTEDKLHEFFQAKTTAISVNSQPKSKDVKNFLTEPKQRTSLDILIRREAITRYYMLPQQQGVDQAIASIVDAVNRCDYTGCSPGMLEEIQKVVVNHLEQKENHTAFMAFVEQNGPDAFQVMDHPHLHRLLHGVLLIPSVIPRLDCIILESGFAELSEHYVNSLTVLCATLQALHDRKGPLRRFFQTALHLGNAINSDANGPVVQHGFKLASLPKFLELKAPKRKEVTFMHFVLLWMTPSDVKDLCGPEIIELLWKAKCTQTFTVFNDIMQLMDGFCSIVRFVETGKYKGKDIPRCSPPDGQRTSNGSESTSTSGGSTELNDDGLHTRMRNFVQQQTDRSRYLWNFAQNTISTYRALGCYLDDVKMVYPPPAENTEVKGDLFAIIYNLITTLKNVFESDVLEEVQKELKAELGFTAPIFGGEVRGHPIGPPTDSANEPSRTSPAKSVPQQSATASKSMPVVASATPAKASTKLTNSHTNDTGLPEVANATQPGKRPPAAAKTPAPSASAAPVEGSQQPSSSDAGLGRWSSSLGPRLSPESDSLRVEPKSGPPRVAPRVPVGALRAHFSDNDASACSPSVSASPDATPKAESLAGNLRPAEASPPRRAPGKNARFLPAAETESFSTFGHRSRSPSTDQPFLRNSTRAPSSRETSVSGREVSHSRDPPPTREVGVAPTFGPPLRKPGRRGTGPKTVQMQDDCNWRNSSRSSTSPRSAGRRSTSPRQAEVGFLGAPLLDASFESHCSSGAEFGIQPLMSPKPIAPSPFQGQIPTPARTPGTRVSINGLAMTPQRTPGSIRGASPRSRLGRKSLTRIADRLEVANGLEGSDDRCTPPPNVSPSSQVFAQLTGGGSSTPLSGSQVGGTSADDVPKFGQDLNTQIFNEVRRRKSRGSNGGLLAPPSYAPMTPTLSPWTETDGFESPKPLSNTLYYALTPVKEQGETPYRVNKTAASP